MPPRSMWTGSLSFGLVNVPVMVVSATRDNDVHFHQVRRGDEDGGSPERIEMRRVAEDGKEVPWSKIGKGWELEDGRMLVLTQKDLDSAAPEKTRTIDIEQFVPLADIDAISFDHPYWLIPAGEGEGAARAYSLLLDVMKQAGSVGIGRIVMRNKEQLVALRERDGLLSLTTMKFAEDIRDPQDTGAIPSSEASKPEAREIEDAVALIEEMTDDWKPESYEDTHRTRLLTLIEQKRKQGTVDLPEIEAEPKPQKAPADLMAALEESLAKARGTKKPRAKAPAATAKAEA
jgi:DNA end-binding protein Ku